MNLLSKSFGATGKVSVDLDAKGLHIHVSDSEKLSDQQIDETIRPDVVIDEIVKLVGSPAWLVGIAGFLKGELASLEAK